MNKYINIILFCMFSNTYSALHDLLEACEDGKIEHVKSLIRKTENIEFENGKSSILHVASRKGHWDLVNLLLYKCKNLDTTDIFGDTALHWAVHKGHFDIVNSLLNKKADCNIANHDGETSLHLAAQEGHVDICNLLISFGANINATNDKSLTPLHLACNYGHMGIVDLLLSHNASTDIEDSEGHYPLHIAVDKERSGIVKLLLSADANVNCVDNDSDTPLHKACYRGNLSLVKALLSKGANIRSLNHLGKTPFHEACCKLKMNLIKYLLSQDISLIMMQDNKANYSFSCLPSLSKNDQIKLLKIIENNLYNEYEYPKIDLKQSYFNSIVNNIFDYNLLCKFLLQQGLGREVVENSHIAKKIDSNYIIAAYIHDLPAKFKFIKDHIITTIKSGDVDDIIKLKKLSLFFSEKQITELILELLDNEKYDKYAYIQLLKLINQEFQLKVKVKKKD